MTYTGTGILVMSRSEKLTPLGIIRGLTDGHPQIPRYHIAVMSGVAWGPLFGCNGAERIDRQPVVRLIVVETPDGTVPALSHPRGTISKFDL